MDKVRAFIVSKPFVCCAVSAGFGLFLGAVLSSI